MTAVCEAVDVDELVALFAGDDHSAGYPCVTLVKEICRRTSPAAASDVYRRIFGDWPPDLVSHQARCAIAVGYAD